MKRKKNLISGTRYYGILQSCSMNVYYGRSAKRRLHQIVYQGSHSETFISRFQFSAIFIFKQGSRKQGTRKHGFVADFSELWHIWEKIGQNVILGWKSAKMWQNQAFWPQKFCCRLQEFSNSVSKTLINFLYKIQMTKKYSDPPGSH